MNYYELASGLIGISKSDYETLPVNDKGIKKAMDIADGTQLEVFDEDTGKIVTYAEAIKELWFER